jgi:glycosyltransferase involved in cell wall biosynthesis
MLLFVGRLVPSKGLRVAFEAFRTSRLAGRARFVVAGDGPSRNDLERIAPEGVEFLGSCDAERLRRLYHAADALVFPSLYDPWGLVLNEAACASLPALASTGAGSAVDLIRDGQNGWLIEADNVAAWRKRFDRIADDPTQLAALRPGAAAIARASTPRACAAGLCEAIA